MKITAIKTYLMHCAPPEAGGWSARNWLFVKVETDEGIHGVGEASGWPRVVETALGQALEDYDLLFYEDPVAPENIEAIARVSSAVDIPIAAGERHAGIWGVKELIEREIIDVVHPGAAAAIGVTQR